MLSENINTRRILTFDNVVDVVSHMMRRRPGCSIHDKPLMEHDFTVTRGRMAAALTVGSNGDAINSYASRRRYVYRFRGVVLYYEPQTAYANYNFSFSLCSKKSRNYTSKLYAGCVAILHAMADIQLDTAELFNYPLHESYTRSVNVDVECI